MFLFSDIGGVKLFAAALLLLFFLQGCYKEFSTDVSFNNPIQKKDCHDGDPCSLELNFVAVNLTCENGEIPDPKDIKVFFTASNEELDGIDLITVSESLSIQIASDNQLNDIDFNGTSITLEVSLSRFRTWKGEFVVARNCCHVFSPEGQSLNVTI